MVKGCWSLYDRFLAFVLSTQEIWDELRHLCPDFYGATYEKMGELGFIQWPCRDTSDADQGDIPRLALCAQVRITGDARLRAAKAVPPGR